MRRGEFTGFAEPRTRSAKESNESSESNQSNESIPSNPSTGEEKKP
jgi:hypothetical protein